MAGSDDIGTIPRVIIGVSGLFLALSWIAVSMRIYVRAVMLRCFGLDDWLMVISCVRIAIFSARHDSH